MPQLAWDHVHLRSPDPEATAQWFERMLGAQVIRSLQDGKPRIDLKLGGVNIFIAPVAPGDGVNAPPTTPYQGLDHFGLSVSGIDEVAAELKAKGAEFTMEPRIRAPASRFASCAGRKGSPSNCSSATRNTPKCRNLKANCHWIKRAGRLLQRVSIA